MSMLQLTKDELQSHNALTPIINGHIQQVTNAVPFPINLRMKAVIAVAHLTNFASQFRRNIKLWDDAIVPINAISFVITGSGGYKDSSNRAAEKCFSVGYDMIEAKRQQLVKEAAIKKASEAGEDSPSEFEVYKAYMQPIPPMNMSVTTGPGLIQHINDTADLPLSSSFMYSGEVSDELSYNPDMMENIKILSEVYDLGIREMKYTKGVEHRSKAINGQPVSALFVGSPGHILYDESTKKKFHVAFMSKLARRSWFCYCPERINDPVFTSVDEMLDYETALETSALEARKAMRHTIEDITHFGLSSVGHDITVTEPVFRLFKTYKRYNSDYADTFVNQDSTSALIRRHLQWKALKLAGAFAICDKSNSINQRHYVEAIQFCELLAGDMDLFEHDLNKATHERFSDFIRTQVQTDGKATINVHELKKQSFIASPTKAKLQELVALCSGYDLNGLYSVINEGTAIQYEPIIKTDVVSISFKPIHTTALNNAVLTGDADLIKEAKHQIAMSATYGFEYGQTNFADLANLLSDSYAYSPFQFRNGTRGKDNLMGGTKWLVFDIDNSSITASEAHFLLSDINHHIALGSNPSNDLKFHVLIELDSVVELDPLTWKQFYTSVADHLALRVDLLPQSQIFFSYSDRPLMSVVDASTLPVRQFILDAKERRSAAAPRPLSTAQQSALLSDPLNTFAYAFECPINGAGSRSLIRAAYHARDLGATCESTLSLMQEINSYWELPMEPTRFSRILEQVARLF